MRTTTHATGRARRTLLVSVACGATVAGSAGAALAATPTATTLPIDPTLVDSTYALLSGELNPNGFTVGYRFQWGRTTAYGNETPFTQAGNGKALVPVDAVLDQSDGLKPNRTYHFRLVVSPSTTAGDHTYLPDIAGADETFKTPPRLAVRFVGDTAAVVRKTAKVKLKAVGPEGGVAKGKLTLEAKLGKGKRAKPKTIGSATYRIAVGKTKAVAVKLSGAARKAVKGGTLDVTASAKTKGLEKALTHDLVLEA